MDNKKILVVYYTRTGVSKLVAETIKDKLNCDIEEIVELKNRMGALQYILAGKDALKGNTTEIKPMTKNPSDYDLVIIGGPVWASHTVPAIRTYIEKYKNDFKEVAFFATQGGSGGEKTLSDMETVSNKTPVSTLIISKKQMDDKSYIKMVENFIK